ncbi:MAG: GntR family transcriptional regulator, partial [Mesorhizobium sp.]
HLTVIEALESRDPQKAVEAISRHIDNARRLALQI